jgi:hypothetical protein
MAIWKLSPIDATDPRWGVSTHKGAAVIRAPDEQTARAVASTAFGLATFIAHGRATTIHPPWRYAGMVSAERVTGAPWPEEGEVEILDPAAANDEIKGVTWGDT